MSFVIGGFGFLDRFSGTNSYNTQELRFQHLQFICRVALPVGVLVSGTWLLVFALMQNWALLCISTLLFVAISAGWLIARRGNIPQGMLLAQVACIGFIICFSLVFDVHDNAVPRVSHLYLLIIALAGFVNHQLAPNRFQLAIILVAVACFVLFSATPMAFSFATPLTDDVRTITAWTHAAVVTSLLCGGVLLIQRKLGPDSMLARELRSAIAKEQFELFFQPQVDGTGRLIGAEALLRWKHPRLGYVAPDNFIPVAERAGLMPELGGWVLKTAVETLSAWRQDAATQNLVLSINVSPDQFLDENFFEHVTSALESSSVDPRLLQLELTETMFVTDVDVLVNKMKALQRRGIGIALDDFGTGYSSLSYLRQLPLQQLKIDRSFVRAITTERGALLVRSIAQMGHDLGLEILAEGIETDEQFQFMLECGCTTFQGYHFGRPLTLEAFRDRFLVLN
ncbi:putative bifunctional diguanylate cyclase/phosphodiesterase [Agrobacterium rosae]|uniref:EAL domain-containing protein n=2 Tax=Pseudomonadota TaxID=1224 RepID=A0AAE5RTP2_9HYPH|nr:EAL domain-containing protein [Agrobacterium rosae]KAA3518953.1 EAL domain-containing protein [Agrobacterium rosae]MQB49320.1 EAL domain-containing protein [Agrobacterium rosae]POO49161.1 EAL domain-containing protein [Agrobacterium rosae]